MKIYLDSLDSFYSIKHIEQAEKPKSKSKPKKDYAGIGAVIFTFTVLSIVIDLSIYTAWQIAYGQNDTNDENRIQYLVCLHEYKYQTGFCDSLYGQNTSNSMVDKIIED
jgi:hypothetical protein